jgi:hypothetical protein
MYSFVVAIDFDKTLAGEASYPFAGDPIPGAREALEALKSAGAYIIIWSCRNNPEAMTELSREVERSGNPMQVMKDWLDKHGIPYDEIDLGVRGKPKADFYVDDKAVPFDGNWSSVVEMIADRVSARDFESVAPFLT